MSSENEHGTSDFSNVTSLFGNKPSAAGIPPQPDVIERLSQMLEEAKRGEIVAFACVGFSPIGDFVSGTWGKVPYTTMVGALEFLKHRITVRQIEFEELPR